MEGGVGGGGGRKCQMPRGAHLGEGQARRHNRRHGHFLLEKTADSVNQLHSHVPGPCRRVRLMMHEYFLHAYPLIGSHKVTNCAKLPLLKLHLDLVVEQYTGEGGGIYSTGKQGQGNGKEQAHRRQDAHLSQRP